MGKLLFVILSLAYSNASASLLFSKNLGSIDFEKASIYVTVGYNNNYTLNFEGHIPSIKDPFYSTTRQFIEAMTGLNEIALSGKDLTAGDRHAIIVVNKAIRKSELPLFTFDPPSLSENEVLPFSH